MYWAQNAGAIFFTNNLSIAVATRIVRYIYSDRLQKYRPAFVIQVRFFWNTACSTPYALFVDWPRAKDALLLLLCQSQCHPRKTALAHLVDMGGTDVYLTLCVIHPFAINAHTTLLDHLYRLGGTVDEVCFLQ